MTASTRALCRIAGLLAARLGLHRRRDRSEYRSVWNAAALTEDAAKTSVIGSHREQDIQATAAETLQRIEECVGLGTEDRVLEIGAGVGRVGAVVAPRCAEWVGADVSDNMLSFAERRLADLHNASFQRISGYDLDGLESERFDLVYCTVVFMHLDEWDRYNYVREAWRVLKPGGRIYVDNTDLCTDEGWRFFLKNMTDYPPSARPANISKSSTPDELRTYLEHAGFEDIRTLHYGMWLTCCGIKPLG